MKNGLFAVVILAALVDQASAQATRYWDINGATAGAGGATPTGTWDNAITNWNTAAGGTGAATTWSNNGNARFAAGTDATGSYTVTVSGTVNVNQIGMEEGNVTFSGGTLNFTHAAGATSLLTGITGGAANTTATINSQMTGTSGFRIARSTVAGTQIAIIGNSANTLTGGYFTNIGQTTRLGASNVIADANLVTVNSGGILDVNGMTETVTSLSGTGASPAVTLGSGSLILSAPAGEGFSGIISGAGSFTKNGGGTYSLTGANSYTGGTTIGGGILQVGTGGTQGNLANGAAATAPIAINGNGILRFNRSDAVSHSLSGVISGNGSIEKLGANTIVLNNPNNTYSGGTTISGGTISVDGDGTLGSGTVTLAGGTLNTTANRSPSTNPIANAINVTASSTISTTSAAANAEVNFSSNSIAGTAGTVTFRNDGADNAADVFDPRFSGSGFDMTRPIVVDNGAVGTTRLSFFNPVGTSQTFSGVISGNGNLRRSATNPDTGGDTILTGANTYTGGTTINGGRLLANNTSGSATGTGGITVNSGGTLAGTGAVSGAVTVNSGGTLAPGASIESLDTGAVTFNNASTFAVELNTNAPLSVAADLVNANGNLSIVAGAILSLVDLGNTYVGGAKFTLISYAGTWDNGIFLGHADDSLVSVGVNQYKINYNDTSGGSNFGGGAYGNYLTLTAVPEASAFVFGGLACVVGGLLQVRRVLARRRSIGLAS